jgi:hypothetical protein
MGSTNWIATAKCAQWHSETPERLAGPILVPSRTIPEWLWRESDDMRFAFEDLNDLDRLLRKGSAQAWSAKPPNQVGALSR